MHRSTAASVFERWNNRPYTDEVRQAGKTYSPTLETADGQKVLPRYFIDAERAGPEMLVFCGPNALHPGAADGDLWVAGMTCGVIIEKITV